MEGRKAIAALLVHLTLEISALVVLLQEKSDIFSRLQNLD